MAAATPATAVLDGLAIPYTLHAYRHDPRSTAFGDEAVAALGVDPDRFFKTLVVTVEGMVRSDTCGPRADSAGRRGPGQACGVVPVSGKLDLKAFARAAQAKRAAMADLALVERITGYVRGGISAIGQKSEIHCVVDESAILWPSVVVSAGQRGLSVELAPDDLLRAVDGRYAAIAEPAV